MDNYRVKYTTMIAKLLMLIYINCYNVNLITIKGGSIMKKILFSLLAVGAILMGGLLPAQSASALPAETDVTGVITDAGVPVAGATVTVKCGAFTKMDTTDAFGSYLVSFTFAQCPPGSTVTVTAMKGAKTGTKTGTVIGVTTKLNIGLVNVDIPEYGIIGAAIATGAGIGAIAFTRRRFAQQGTAV